MRVVRPHLGRVLAVEADLLGGELLDERQKFVLVKR
jgi:hypothetical protein